MFLFFYSEFFHRSVIGFIFILFIFISRKFVVCIFELFWYKKLMTKIRMVTAFENKNELSRHDIVILLRRSTTTSEFFCEKMQLQ